MYIWNMCICMILLTCRDYDETVSILFQRPAIIGTETLKQLIRYKTNAPVICNPRPSGPRESGAFNFSIFQYVLKKFILWKQRSPAKSPALWGQICCKIPAKCPSPQGLTMMNINKWPIIWISFPSSPYSMAMPHEIWLQLAQLFHWAFTNILSWS